MLLSCHWYCNLRWYTWSRLLPKLTTADQTPHSERACWEDGPAHSNSNLGTSKWIRDMYNWCVHMRKKWKEREFLWKEFSSCILDLWHGKEFCESARRPGVKMRQIYFQSFSITHTKSNENKRLKVKRKLLLHSISLKICKFRNKPSSSSTPSVIASTSRCWQYVPKVKKIKV